MQCLKPIKRNTELYYVIALEGIQYERPVSYMGQLTAKGCQSLAQLWGELIAVN